MVQAVSCQWYRLWAANGTRSELPMVQAVSCQWYRLWAAMVQAVSCQWYMQWAANDTCSELPMIQAVSCQWHMQRAANGQDNRQSMVPSLLTANGTDSGIQMTQTMSCQWYWLRAVYGTDTDCKLPMVHPKRTITDIPSILSGTSHCPLQSFPAGSSCSLHAATSTMSNAFIHCFHSTWAQIFFTPDFWHSHMQHWLIFLFMTTSIPLMFDNEWKKLTD